MVPRHERGGSPEALRLDRGSPKELPRVLEAAERPRGERRGAQVPELHEPRDGLRLASGPLLLGLLPEHARELLLGFREGRHVPRVIVEVAEDREPEARGVRGGEAERGRAREGRRRRGSRRAGRARRRRRTRRRTSGRVDCRIDDESFSPSMLWPNAAFDEFDPHRGSTAPSVMPEQGSGRTRSGRGSSSSSVDGTGAHFFLDKERARVRTKS